MCFICRVTIGNGLQTVSSEDRYFVLLKKNISIPEDARCCPQQSVDRRLTFDAINRIKPLTVQYTELNSNDVQLIINTWQMFFRQQRRFDFDDDRSLTDDEY